MLALEVSAQPAGVASLANRVTAVVLGQRPRAAALGWAHVSGRSPRANASREVGSQSTTASRLSGWRPGRFARTDRSGDLRPCLLQPLAEGARLLRSAAPPCTPD